MADNAPLRKALLGIPGVDAGDEPEEPDETADNDSKNYHDDGHDPAPPGSPDQANESVSGGSHIKFSASHEQQDSPHELVVKSNPQVASSPYLHHLHAIDASQQQAGALVVPGALAVTAYPALSASSAPFAPLASSSVENKDAALVLKNNAQPL
jgi:hypothetical protein